MLKLRLPKGYLILSSLFKFIVTVFNFILNYVIFISYDYVRIKNNEINPMFKKQTVMVVLKLSCDTASSVDSTLVKYKITSTQIIF